MNTNQPRILEVIFAKTNSLQKVTEENLQRLLASLRITYGNSLEISPFDLHNTMPNEIGIRFKQVEDSQEVEFSESSYINSLVGSIGYKIIVSSYSSNKPIAEAKEAGASQ